MKKFYEVNFLMTDETYLGISMVEASSASEAVEKVEAIVEKAEDETRSRTGTILIREKDKDGKIISDWDKYKCPKAERFKAEIELSALMYGAINMRVVVSELFGVVYGVRYKVGESDRRYDCSDPYSIKIMSRKNLKEFCDSLGIQIEEGI